MVNRPLSGKAAAATVSAIGFHASPPGSNSVHSISTIFVPSSMMSTQLNRNTLKDIPIVKLNYDVVGTSEHSGEYIGEHVKVDRPGDQASRWSCSRTMPSVKSWILLQVETPVVLSESQALFTCVCICLPGQLYFPKYCLFTRAMLFHVAQQSYHIPLYIRKS